MRTLTSVLCLAALLMFSSCALNGRPSSGGPSAALPSVTNSIDHDLNPQVLEPILSAYYAAKGESAYKLMQSGMISRVLGHWTAKDIGDAVVSPKWNVESFTQYRILDHNLNPAEPDDTLFYCTFSADDGKHGYAVLKYEAGSDGGGLGNAGAVETPYLYDLEAHMDDIADALAQTSIDLSAATAARARLVDASQNRADEIILFEDSGANAFVYNLSTMELEAFHISE